MKKLLLISVFFLVVLHGYGQTLFTYGHHKVEANEFMDAYNKNKTAAGNDSQALRNYLALYINFKLKVQAARDSRLDTLPSMKADLQNFRSQIQDAYLKDPHEVDRLVNQAFQRSQKDIHAVYYFIPSTGDSLADLKRVNAIAAALRAGQPDSLVMEKANASLSGTVRKEDLGYITVFSLPYPFENAIYRLRAGNTGTPFRARGGWYLFRNEGERKAVGSITVAQILLAVPQGSKYAGDAAKRLADSLYMLLQQGADFGVLAKKYSDDRNTYMNGGLMPEFGTAKYDTVFENHAFALQHDAEISKPFETPFGYHILKRIAAQAVPTTPDNKTFMYNLKQQVLADNRVEIAKKEFLREIYPVIGLTRKKVDQNDLWRVTDSALLANKSVRAGHVDRQTTLLSFNNGQQLRVADWILFVKNSGQQVDAIHRGYQQVFPDFVNRSAVANYASRMEVYNPDFRAQLNEFEEGNLLFEIMQKKVWGKAAADTAGLKKFYEMHKMKYLWQSSAAAVIFSCSNVSVARQSIRALKNGIYWRDVVNENPNLIQADSGRFELGQIPVVDRTAFTEGMITLPVVNKTDGTAVFAQIFKLYPANEQRNFQDARGLVINDYQNYLEAGWIAQLKKKYPVTVYEKTFRTLVH